METDEKIDLEEQFILRLPAEEAMKIRQILKEKPEKIKKVLKIDLDPDEWRNAKVSVNKTKYSAALKRLPTIVESYKTNIANNKSALFKTANVNHMLICNHEINEMETIDYEHGLTPPLKNVKRRRFRKTLINTDQAVEVEGVLKELFYLLRTDMEAASTKFEVIYENDNSATEMLFGTMSSDSEDES